jgi:hypothetical protein
MVWKRRRYVLAAAMLVGLAAGSYAVAAKGFGPLHRGDPPNSKEFRAHLNGYQEVPSVSSTGVGEFRAKLVEPEKLHYVFRYKALEGGASLFAHVHFGQRSVNGGVTFFLCSTTPPIANKPTCPNVEGTVEGDITPADVVSSTQATAQGIEPLSFAEILRAMRAGHAYANIHTTRWGGGEIRGQINDHDQKEFDK